jgi:hypothetical protein
MAELKTGLDVNQIIKKRQNILLTSRAASNIKKQEVGKM